MYRIISTPNTKTTNVYDKPLTPENTFGTKLRKTTPCWFVFISDIVFIHIPIFQITNKSFEKFVNIQKFTKVQYIISDAIFDIATSKITMIFTNILTSIRIQKYTNLFILTIAIMLSRSRCLTLNILRIL